MPPGYRGTGFRVGYDGATERSISMAETKLLPAVARDASLVMTADEFITSERDEGGLTEWIDGRVIVHDMPKEAHQRIAGLVFFLLSAFVGRRHLGRVIIAPYKMLATPNGPVREPDVLYLAIEHLDRLTENVLMGPADLVVEVVSDDSTARDRADKFDEYQDGGVREYWVIDSRPGHERADFWLLDATGRYRSALPDADRTYRSSVLPGCWLSVDWLWQVDADLWAMAQEMLTTD
jgi:Uma2 family endonuclease